MTAITEQPAAPTPTETEVIEAISHAMVSAGFSESDPTNFIIEFKPGRHGYDMAIAFAAWLRQTTGITFGAFPPEWEGPAP